MTQNIRVIHLPFATGNNSLNLSTAERNIIDSNVMLFGREGHIENTINYDKYDLRITYRNKITAIFKILMFYLFALRKYDVFHFNSGSTLISSTTNSYLDMVDLLILNFFKKKIIVTYQGGTGRLKKSYYYYNDMGDGFIADGLFENEDSDKVKLRRINKVLKYSDLIYSTNPDLLVNFNSKGKFRPYTKLKLNNDYNYKSYINNPIVIGHAPSTLSRKGTAIIESVIDELKLEGYILNYFRFHNLSNEDVLKRIRTADLIIDQVFAGWYGGLAVECWNYGIPVMSYISEISKANISFEMNSELPIILTSARTLKSDLIKILNKPKELLNISRKSNDFVRKYHDLDKVAKSVIEDYKKLF